MNLNPVKEKAEAIKRVRSPEFWTDVTVGRLEEIRTDLRTIMKYVDKGQAGPGETQMLTYNIEEDETGIKFEERSSNFLSIDMAAYRQRAEAALKKLFETDPTLQKIRACQPVSEADLERLVSLVLIQNPDIDLNLLRQFYPQSAGGLDIILRGLVGLEEEAVRDHFQSFVQHHQLNAKQVRFLRLLENHISQNGGIRPERLVDAPFTSIDAEGVYGVFHNDAQRDELLGILRNFIDPQEEAETKMITGELKSRIDKLWEEFWTGGITNPLTVIEQISFLMFSRLLDMTETRNERKAELSGKPFPRIFSDDQQKLRWSHFNHYGSVELLEHVRDKVFPHFKTVTAEGASFGEYMKDAQLLIQKPSLLSSAVGMIDKLPLGDADTKGDLYEYLLSKLTTAGINGQFRTPRHIIRLMVELIDPDATDTIGDPACGTGGFLVGAAEYLQQKYTSLEGVIEHHETGEKTYTGDLLEPHRAHFQSGMFHGFDFDSTMLRIAAMNLLLHGVDAPDIHYQDTLATSFTDKFPRHATDSLEVILANPPFKGSLDEDDVHPNLLKSVKTKKTELLFVTLILRMLKLGGRSATIVPDGVLFGSSKAHQELRKVLVEENQLEGVISLPSGVFKPYAGVSTAILLFTKGGKTDNVFFYDVEADGFTLDDKRTKTEANDLPNVLKRWKERDPAKDTDKTGKAFFVSADEIKTNKYDLSVSRYKEVIYEEEQYDPPQEILTKMMKLHDDIANDMLELEGMLR